jgi:exonuclease SbcD
VRILACSDTHLGQPLEGLPPQVRLQDQADVLQRIADLAHEENVDLLLHGGDVYHRPNPPAEVEHVFRDFITALNGIPVVVIGGNSAHDGAMGRTAPQLFDDRIVVSRRPEVHRVAGVFVATLPNVPSAQYVAARDGGDRDEANREIADHLLKVASGLRAEIAEDELAVLLLHWSISGAALPTGLSTDHLREPVLPLPELEALGFDAIIAGHIHKPQVLDSGIATTPGREGSVFYAGSPLPLDFGETSCEHGVWILEADVSDGETVARFVPIPSRPLVSLDYDFTLEPEQGLSTPVERMGFGLSLPNVMEAVVRVRYRATAEQARRIDQAVLRQALADAGAAAVQMRPEIVREDRVRVAGITDDLDPLVAFDLWAGEQPDLSAGMRVRLRDAFARDLETVS